MPVCRRVAEAGKNVVGVLRSSGLDDVTIAAALDASRGALRPKLQPRSVKKMAHPFERIAISRVDEPTVYKIGLRLSNTPNRTSTEA